MKSIKVFFGLVVLENRHFQNDSPVLKVACQEIIVHSACFIMGAG